MQPPLITIGYLAALAGLFSVFSLVVVALRARHDIPFGDGGNEMLNRAIRVHGNFSEWVPLTILLVGSVEALGAPAGHLHGLLATLLEARIFHAVGLFSAVRSAPYMVGRIVGASSTWAVLSASAIYIVTLL